MIAVVDCKRGRKKIEIGGKGTEWNETKRNGTKRKKRAKREGKRGVGRWVPGKGRWKADGRQTTRAYPRPSNDSRSVTHQTVKG